MTWFRIDDQLPSHEKTLQLPRGARRLQAIGAFTLLGAWSAGHLTDGRIPSTVLEEMGIPPRTVEDLVLVGFLDRGDQLDLHDFLDWNKSAEQVLAERAEAAKRQKKARERAKAKREAEENAASEGESHAVTPTVTHGVTGPEGENTDSNRTSVPFQPDKRPIIDEGGVNVVGATNGRNSTTSTNTESHGVTHGDVTAVVTGPPTLPDPSLSTSLSHFGKSAPVSDVREPEGSPGVAESILVEWTDRCDRRPPGKVVNGIGVEVARMLHEGVPADHIREGLAAWARKGGTGPGALPSFVNDVMNRPAGQLALRNGTNGAALSTTDQRVGAGLTLAAKLRAQEDQA
jgi:hypothetical protein